MTLEVDNTRRLTTLGQRHCSLRILEPHTDTELEIASAPAAGEGGISISPAALAKRGSESRISDSDSPILRLLVCHIAEVCGHKTIGTNGSARCDRPTSGCPLFSRISSIRSSAAGKPG